MLDLFKTKDEIKDKFIIFSDGSIRSDIQAVQEFENGFMLKGHPCIIMKMPISTDYSAPNIDLECMFPMPYWNPNGKFIFSVQEWRSGRPMQTISFARNYYYRLMQMKDEIRSLRASNQQLWNLINDAAEMGLLPANSMLGQQYRQLKEILGPPTIFLPGQPRRQRPTRPTP